jgi:hypothetical protein
LWTLITSTSSLDKGFQLSCLTSIKFNQFCFCILFNQAFLLQEKWADWASKWDTWIPTLAWFIRDFYWATLREFFHLAEKILIKYSRTTSLRMTSLIWPPNAVKSLNLLIRSRKNWVRRLWTMSRISKKALNLPKKRRATNCLMAELLALPMKWCSRLLKFWFDLRGFSQRFWI